MLIIAPIKRHKNNIISIFFNMKVCCVFSLESPHQNDSIDYTRHTIINIEKQLPKIILKIIMSATMGFLVVRD